MSEKRGIFDWYFKSNLLIRIFVGLVLGAIVGITLAVIDPELAGKVNGYVAPFGAAFVRLLQMIMIPVILFTLVVGTSSIQPSRLGRIGVKILAFYLITSAFAAVIGLVVGGISRPGVGVELAAGQEIAVRKGAPLSQVLLEIIPTNFFGALASGTVLPIIFFALMMGIALAFLRENKDERVHASATTVFKFFDGMAEIIFIIVRWVMQYAPIGVFALMVSVFALNGSKVVGPLVKVTIVVYIGLAIHLFLVYGSFLATNGLNILGFIKKARDPMVTAFVTRSSGGTLPITMRTADNMGINKSVYSFTLPIGATVNMDGTTIYMSICAMFIANAVGAPLEMSQMFQVVVVAVLASIGTAGVPGAGAIMLMMVLETIGLGVGSSPIIAAAYGMILGVDALLDMGRTSMNVTGDLVGTLWVAKGEGADEFNKSKYDSYTGVEL